MPNGLTIEQKKFYDDNGYILVKGVFTKQEAAVLRAEAHALADRLSKIRDIDATWDTIRTSGEKKTVILHCHDVQFQSAAMARMMLDPRFTSIAQSIIGPNVQLHHTKMFIKPPEKGSPFPMHQDYPYFPHERHSMIAAIVHFDDAPVEKGCVRVYPGTHKLGPLDDGGTRDHSLPKETYSVENAVPCPAEAGDVLFFSYLTVHGSGVNESKEARTTVLVQMRDPLDPPTAAVHLSRGQGMMLAGVDPSCGAATAIQENSQQSAMGMAGGMGIGARQTVGAMR
ncbi:MAG TPA: phytanoyl-CoA dioxygenase family protein [Tepidisphaeraceae bacterium]|jgi:ectoine hydroxylase-related dioxygenase (phytanoyl-CoA dioxygenase family)|nr:phytanoyl-CoA dioxygenase family protein [Tepidisphaeraceae bacterium]